MDDRDFIDATAPVDSIRVPGAPWLIVTFEPTPSESEVTQ